MPLPDFLCIGAQKAGTTWLHSMLDQHPDIYLGPFKECQYFSTVHVPLHRKWTRGHVKQAITYKLKQYVKTEKTIDPSYVELLARLIDDERMLTEEWYREIYSVPEAKYKCRGDITPEYSTIPIEGVRHVQRLMPGAKIIYMIRDPLSRMISQLRMNLVRQKENYELEEYQWSKWILNPNLHNRGNYKEYIPRWESVYGKAEILYIPFGDLKNNPDDVLRSVENHIGIMPKKYLGINDSVHETKKIEIPIDVKNKLKEILSPQYDFLIKHFGEEFVARI